MRRNGVEGQARAWRAVIKWEEVWVDRWPVPVLETGHFLFTKIVETRLDKLLDFVTRAGEQSPASFLSCEAGVH